MEGENYSVYAIQSGRKEIRGVVIAGFDGERGMGREFGGGFGAGKGGDAKVGDVE